MNDYFCVLPFYGAEYTLNGDFTPCCLISENSDIKQIQKEMLNQQRPVACKKCWNLEDQGKISNRQLENSTFDFYKDVDIRYIEKNCREGKFSPQIIKLYTSNICNSTCVTCGSEASSAWATLENKKTFRVINRTIIDSLDYKNIIKLSFVGGEPLAEKKNFEILNLLLLNNNKNCFISFVSNGSILLTDKQKFLLAQFKNVNICLSIDGIESKFEYIRYPLKWDILLSNIEFFRSININVSVSYTLSNLNILYYYDTINWFTKNNLNYNHNIVTSPDYFSITALPLEIKNRYPELSNFFGEHSESDDINFLKFCEEIKRQDKLKGISIKDYLPELARNIV